MHAMGSLLARRSRLALPRPAVGWGPEERTASGLPRDARRAASCWMAAWSKFSLEKWIRESAALLGRELVPAAPPAAPGVVAARCADGPPAPPATAAQIPRATAAAAAGAAAHVHTRRWARARRAPSTTPRVSPRGTATG